MKKILVIEDNREIRENTAELLRLSNYTVIEAENGYMGFLMAKHQLPDLILCDMMMPKTDGYEFLKLARKDKEICNIPIVYFSAGSPTPDLQQIMISLADGYLKKPFTEEELLVTIERSLPGAAGC